MATGTIPFMPGSATFPDGSAGNLPAAIHPAKSSGGPPGIYDLRLRFDATNEQWCQFKTATPADFNAGVNPVAKIAYVMETATANGVALDVRIAAMSDADTSIGAKAFGAANIGTATVPGAVGTVDVMSIPLVNRDVMASGDTLWVYLGRATGNAADTAVGFLDVTAFWVEYTTV